MISFIWDICLARPYPFKFFKDCLPPILLGPFLNTLSHYLVIIHLRIQNIKTQFKNKHRLLLQNYCTISWKITAAMKSHYKESQRFKTANFLQQDSKVVIFSVNFTEFFRLATSHNNSGSVFLIYVNKDRQYFIFFLLMKSFVNVSFDRIRFMRCRFLYRLEFFWKVFF